ncbi:YtpR family tRNA-binding protein [Leuconostoc mesenteroides]
MITSYNQKSCGDILVVTLAPNAEKQTVTTSGNVTRISNAETDQVTGFNIANVGVELGIIGENGQIFLNEEQINILNANIKLAGFDELLKVSPSKLVIGFVDSLSNHPDSDHLHITQTKVSDQKSLQIVSGSPNMKTGIKVVVAQPGTMMPSGALIWDGALRGVPSSGMIVSGRELHLPGAPEKPGALILPNDFGEIGDVFDFEKGAKLYTNGLVDTNY